MGRITTPMTWNLSLTAPGMARPHRVGLAGLWATLQVLEEDGSPDRLRPVLRWDRNANGVVLSFASGWQRGVEKLAEEAFKLTPEGFIWLAPLGDPRGSPEKALVLQDALLASFLQHAKSRQADALPRPSGSVAIEVDGTTRTVRYRRVGWYKHQRPPWRGGALEVVSWLLPGGGERHTGLSGRTRLVEPLERALCLLFLPTGAFFYRIVPAVREPVRLEAAVVLADPLPGQLDKYGVLRRAYLRFGAEKLVVSGPAEAALRVAVSAADIAASGVIGDLEVWAFARTPWAPQQRYRARVDVGAPVEDVVRQFRLARACLEEPRKKVIPLRGVEVLDWIVPQTPEWIASNLLRRRPWWEGFAEFLAPPDRRDKVLGYFHSRGRLVRIATGEKGGLAHMVRENELFPPGPERRFVEAVQEAWRRRLGQLSELARTQGRDFRDLANREYERWRVAFDRCRNEATIREAVTDLLARAGPFRELDWTDILAVCRDWRKGRDLALLALASYARVAGEEAPEPSEVSV